MSVLLQVDFPFDGPFGEENLSEMQLSLARSIAEEPGLIWKIWTENKQTHEAGGIYMFTDRKAAETYLAMHCRRLEQAGIADIRAKLFAINRPLSIIDKVPPSILEG